MNNRIKQFIRSTKAHSAGAFFACSSLAEQAVLLGCQIVALRFVPPELMGVWQVTMLYALYATVTRLGIVNGLGREYPYFLGAGKDEEAGHLVQVAQLYSLCNAGIVALLFLVLLVINWSRGVEWRSAMAVGVAVFSLRVYEEYLIVTFRSSRAFVWLARISLIRIPVHLSLLLLPAFWGYWGYLAREAGLITISVGLLHTIRPVRTRPRWRWGDLRLLFSTGWRLYASAFLTQVSRSLPRAILAFISVTAVGLFTPVNWMYTSAVTFASILSQYLFPTLTFKLAQRHMAVGRLALGITALMMLLMLPVFAAVFFILPVLVERLLPQYTASIPAIRICVPAVWLELSGLTSLAFTTAKAWTRLFVYVIASLAVRAIALYAGCRLLPEDPLVGLAWGLLIANVISAPLICLMAYPVKTVPPEESLGEEALAGPNLASVGGEGQ